MIQKPGGLVRLKDLTASNELRGLRSLYLANPAAPVRELALVSHFEELVSVGPDTVVLLSPGVARGGWMISAALRYAWERKACALIVPEQAFTETVIELARRLDISLLSSEAEMSRLAIDVAIQIGVARAGSLARLQAFTNGLSHATSLTEALHLTSEELGGARISLESSGVTILQSKSAPERETDTFTAAALDRVAASIMPATAPHVSSSQRKPATTVSATAASATAAQEMLVAEVAPSSRLLAEEVLHAATPVMRALLAETRLQATRDSLPLLTTSALLATSKAIGLAEPALDEISHLNDTSFASPLSGRYAAVFFMAPANEHLGSLVHQVWHTAVPGALLAKLSDGWLGVAPLTSEESTDKYPLVSRLRDAVKSGGARAIRVGVSRVHETPGNTYEAIREAWFAARVAEPLSGADQALIEFDRITADLVPSVLTPEFAMQLVEELLPSFLADPACAELARSVIAFLENHGSITAAAETLQVHRNTLQTRLRRAEELGVQLSNPNEVLAIHLLLNSLLNSRHWK